MADYNQARAQRALVTGSLSIAARHPSGGDSSDVAPDRRHDRAEEASVTSVTVQGRAVRPQYERQRGEFGQKRDA